MSLSHPYDVSVVVLIRDQKCGVCYRENGGLFQSSFRIISLVIMTISNQQSNFMKCVLIALALDFFDVR